jgi:6-phosphogluconate dehydrogenase
MGGGMVARLLRAGHQVVVFDLDQNAMQTAISLGAETAQSVDDVVARLSTPRIVWVMLPAGVPTYQTLQNLAMTVSQGDIVIDGGNCNYKDSQHQAATFKDRGIHFLDVGTSNGIWGNEEGYGMMIGGDPETVERLRPIFETLAPAPDRGWGRVGPNGAGHYVKTIHNGIEYVFLQAFGEGFELMQHKPEFELDVARVAAIWQEGCVIRSWILEILAQTLKENPTLDGVAPYVNDLGTGQWAVEEAIDVRTPTPVMSLALQWRYRSRMTDPYGDKLVAVLRNRIGGHEIKTKDSES